MGRIFFFAKFYIPTDTRYNFRFWISGMIFAWQRVEKRDKLTYIQTYIQTLANYIVGCVHFLAFLDILDYCGVKMTS